MITMPRIDWSLFLNLMLTCCVIPLIAWGHSLDQRQVVQQGEIDTINAVRAAHYEEIKDTLGKIEGQLDKIQDRLDEKRN